MCGDGSRAMKSFERLQRTDHYTHVISTIHFDTSLQVLLR